MDKHPITELMDSTIQKLREMIDVNTVVGNPITTPDGTTLIPVSKIAVGFGTGGSDIPSKNSGASAFGGGGGAGVTILPVAFVSVFEGTAKVLPISQGSDGTLEKLVETVPELYTKVMSFIKKDKNEEK